MRRSIFNALAVAAGAVLLAALGVSAHGQLSNGFAKTGVRGQLATLHTMQAEVASEAREADATEVPDQTKPEPQATDEPEVQDTEEVDNDTDTETGDDTGDHQQQAPPSGGDTSDSKDTSGD